MSHSATHLTCLRSRNSKKVQLEKEYNNIIMANSQLASEISEHWDGGAELLARSSLSGQPLHAKSKLELIVRDREVLNVSAQMEAEHLRPQAPASDS